MAWENSRDAARERALDAKIEKSFESQQPLPDGRNFVHWNHQVLPGEKENFNKRFDDIFPNAPGAGM